MMTIFADNAPKYWEAGLPVIPLHSNSKMPAEQGWNQYSDKMPDADTQARWMVQYAEGNMGLPLGEQSGLIALDVDTDDEKVRQLILHLLPKTPWVRKGKKGAVYMYRWQGQKTFRIRTIEGASLLEVLSAGTQVVLPPSIHPDTGRPYEATGFLPAMMDQIPLLPKQAEALLRGAIVQMGYELSTKGYTKVTEWISVGARDSKMVSVAGLLALSVMRGERSLFDAIGQMRAWVENFVEKVAGDDLDPEKAVQKLIEFVKKDVDAGKLLPNGWDDDLTDEEKLKFQEQFGTESEVWSIEYIMEYLAQEFAKHDKVTGFKARNQAIDRALKALVANKDILPMDHDALFQYISAASGRAVTIASLRLRVRQLKTGRMIGDTHAEIAHVVIENLNQYGEVRWHHSKFWQWQGSHWEELERYRVLALIATQYGDLPAARRSSDHEGVVKVMQSLLSTPLMQSTQRGINFANGYLTTDLELKDHDPDQGSTYVLPYPYDPERNGACQRFLSFLHQSWGHNVDYKEKVAALREAMAVTLFGLAPLYQRAFCLMGVPHSGKSVLRTIIENLLPPEAVCHVAPSKWNDKFLPTMMDGRLANFCGELSESEMIPGDIFKSIVDGEPMSGQYKGMQIFSFKANCAHWFASNHLPRTRDSSMGFTRRWLFLQFDRAVREADKINGLADDIVAEEVDAIVAWAVGIMPDLQQRGTFTAPASHTALIEEMAGMNNSVRFFMTGGRVRTTQEPNTTPASEQELHAAYWVFCKEQGVRPVSLKTFRARMTEMQSEFGFELKTTYLGNIETVLYLGLILVDEKGNARSQAKTSGS